jgi:hypothetical protein
MKKGYSTATLVTEGGLEGVAKLDHTCRMGLAAVSLNGKRILGLIEQNQPEFFDNPHIHVACTQIWLLACAPLKVRALSKHRIELKNCFNEMFRVALTQGHNRRLHVNDGYLS